ncbi:uncharacterized protein J4E87_001109 [Alternaria ethzedia]|uniref:uncharacterized protein n=1 Tax=Alternaria ethzedia TaxID=181014 RepID=UPI0020C4C8FE|nr:uncharacterized protein J4E87_001109 [Alternaria ethzedia]KAI4633942.1 hypothetical protein J4E87_001109 [Alternaria ethzedia]
MCLVNDISLEITVVNSGSETVTVQSRGQQKFLVPWGPSATETNTLDGRRRVIDQSELNRLPTSSFLIVNAATGKMMHRQQTSICQLRHAKTDLRAKMDELVTLKPGIPLVSLFDIGRTLRSLEDGRYIVRMRPKGCTWWCGELEKEEGEGDRVPARLWKGFTVPIMLVSEDELDITIKDGKVDGKPRLRLGSIAPNFQAKTTHGDMDFHKFLDNKWTILFSHPADFTPVCTTELGAFAKLKDEFDARGVQMIGLSANDLSSHDQWIADINETSNTTVQFPIIADANRHVAFLYDMISQDDLDALQKNGGIAFTIRSVFIIDPAKKIRLTMSYPASTGRNTAEVLRVIDSLQTGDKKGIATPIDWQKGQDVIVPPSVSTEDARKKFGDVREVKKYLRFTNVGQ